MDGHGRGHRPGTGAFPSRGRASGESVFCVVALRFEGGSARERRVPCLTRLALAL